MKKINFILFSLLFTLNCYSQKDLIKPINERESEIRKSRSIFIEKYSDSLNNYDFDDKKRIPQFFLRYNFDRENGDYRIGINDETSFRKLVIDKINNLELLRVVLKSKKKDLKKTVPLPKKSVYGIKAFQEYSTFELVRYRVEELLNESYSGSPP